MGSRKPHRAKCGCRLRYRKIVRGFISTYCAACNTLIREDWIAQDQAMWLAALALWNEEFKRPHHQVWDTREVFQEAIAQDFCCAWARSLLEGE